MDFDYTPQVVSTPAEWAVVYAIRGECFASDETALREGAVRDGYDQILGSRTFLLLDVNRLAIGTIRCCVRSSDYAWQRIPASEQYADVIEGLGTVSIAQSTHFAVSPGHQGRDLLPKLLLIREILRTAIECGVERIVSIIKSRPTCIRFYSRMGFAPIGPVRRHSWANADGVLVGVEPRDFLDSVRASKTMWPIGAFDEERPRDEPARLSALRESPD